MSAKRRCRAVALARRAGQDPEAGAAARWRALAPLLDGVRTVACYASIGAEPGTAGLRAALTAAGVRVLLPVLLPDGDLDWADGSAGLRSGRGGVPAPLGPPLGRQALATVDLVVVPALAVDRRGSRLGRGGGSYDRALPRARCPVVALLHDGELLTWLPAEPHDVAVGFVVTPGDGLVATAGALDR